MAATLSSCRPKGILHSWEMRRVMVDLHKADAILQLNGMAYGHEDEKAIYYSTVLSKHGITQAQFDSSLVWYTAHPQLFDKIYPKVLAQLKSEEDQFVAIHEAELHALQTPMEETAPEIQSQPFTAEQMDSVFWIIRNGYPSSWNIRYAGQPVRIPLLPAQE